jgi:hypothetical protein
LPKKQKGVHREQKGSSEKINVKVDGGGGGGGGGGCGDHDGVS